MEPRTITVRVCHVREGRPRRSCVERTIQANLLHRGRDQVPWDMVCCSTCPSITHLISSCRDTVHSVGLVERHMPFSGANNAIVYTRHALSLDERRVKFRPFFCACGGNGKGGKDTGASGHNRDDSKNTLQIEVRDYETQVNFRRPQTNVEEVFFAGTHSGTFQSTHVQ